MPNQDIDDGALVVNPHDGYNDTAPVSLANDTGHGANPPFSPLDAQLIAGGYEPLACAGKAPVARAWSTRPNTVDALAAERAAHPHAMNTGLRCGRISGVDIDLVDPKHAADIEAIAETVLGLTLMRRVGAKGAMLVYRNETPIPKIRISGKDAGGANRCVEILGTGQQFIAYGDHPDTGKPYAWTYDWDDAEPQSKAVADLPEVTPAMLRQFAQRVATKLGELGYDAVAIADRSEHAAAREQKRRDAKVPVSIDHLKMNLGFIDPERDGDRNAWISILGGIISTNLRDVSPEAMDGELLEIAQAWSRGDYHGGVVPASWKGDDHVAEAFCSLNPMRAGGSTFGTIDREARLGGYSGPPPQETDEEKWGDVLAGLTAHPEATNSDPGATTGRAKLNVLWGHQAEPTDVTWLWKGFIALGKYTALAGAPGTGKSTISFDLAATVSRGGLWPDGTRAPKGRVLIWSGEDDFADTILPRFIAADGYRPNFGCLASVSDWGGEKRYFNPARDFTTLVDALADIPDLLMLIVDPIVSAVTGDDHKNGTVRRGLEPLIMLAQERSFSLFGITHFTKNTQGKNVLDRVTGSLAYGAAARTVLAAGKDENDENAPRRLIRAKNNLEVSDGGFDYMLKQQTVPGQKFTGQRIHWGKRLHGSAYELLGGDGKDKDAILAAATWLDATIRGNGCTMMSKDVREAARENGHSWATIRRAKDKLGNVTIKQNVGAQAGGWSWSIPRNDDVTGPW